MKLPHPTFVVFLASFLLLTGINSTYAPWETLSSGFAVTSDYHKIDVPIGESVTATAAWAPALAPKQLRNVVVQAVEFIWHYPNGTVFLKETVPVSGPIITPQVPPSPIPHETSEWAVRYPDVTYWYAQSTQILTVVGDWGVQAIFHDTVLICGESSDIVRTRSTSFFALPEIPFGTIAILLSTLGVLGVFALRKRHAT